MSCKVRIDCHSIFRRVPRPAQAGQGSIVMDMAENDAGEKIYLLAQSYMPAQDIHILNNPNDALLSPWYKLSNDTDIYTPEYYFTSNQLKTW